MGVFHPRGVMPLVDAEVQPAPDEGSGAPAALLRHHKQQIKVFFATLSERDAWLHALRDASRLSARKLGMLELAKKKVEPLSQ